MIGMIVAKDIESFRKDSLVRLPDGKTVLHRQLILLRSARIAKVIMPADPDAMAFAEAQGFEVFPLAPLLMTSFTRDNLQSALSDWANEDLVVFPAPAIFSKSVLRKLLRSKGICVIVTVRDETCPELRMVELPEELPLSLGAINELENQLPDFQKFPLFKLPRTVYSAAETDSAEDESDTDESDEDESDTDESDTDESDEDEESRVESKAEDVQTLAGENGETALAMPEDSDDGAADFEDEEPEDPESSGEDLNEEMENLEDAAANKGWRCRVVLCMVNHVLWTDGVRKEDMKEWMLPIRLSDFQVWASAESVLFFRKRLETMLAVKRPLLLFAEDGADVPEYWQDASDFVCTYSFTREKSAAQSEQEIRELIREYAPDCLVVTGDMQIQQFAGHVFDILKQGATGYNGVYLVSLMNSYMTTLNPFIELPQVFLCYIAPQWQESEDTIRQMRLSAMMYMADMVNLATALNTPETACDYAYKAGKIVQRCMIGTTWNAEDSVCVIKAFANIMTAKALSGDTPGDRLACWLRDVRGIPAPYAAMLAASVLTGYYYRNIERSVDLRGRRVLADALDEVAAKFSTDAAQLSDLCADLLYWKDWDLVAAELRETEPSGGVEALPPAIGTENSPLPIDAATLQQLIHPFFEGCYSSSSRGAGIIDKLTEAGYAHRCGRYARYYAQMLQARKQRIALCAKQDLQALQLRMFGRFHELCEANGLRYILIGETLFGALQTGAPLPYSQRFEIAMPLKDMHRLEELGDQLGEGIEVLSAKKTEHFYEQGLRIACRDSVWYTKSLLYAPESHKEVGLTVFPLVSASGGSRAERLRLKAAQMLNLIILHKQGIHHRKVGWKGDVVFRLSRRVPAEKLFRLQKKVSLHEDTGDYYLCDCGRAYDVSLIRKDAAFPARQVPFADGMACVPAQGLFQFKEENAFGRLNNSKQNNFLLPGTYYISMPGENGVDRRSNFLLGNPPTKLPAQTKLLKAWRVRTRKKIKVCISRLKKKIKARKAKIRSWYYKTAKPTVKSWLRAQYVRVTGTVRGTGLCLKKSSRELKHYRNLYEGQRCFLIGNGPSLRAEDLDRLRNEVTFGCNFIHKIYPQTNWRPTYHFISDSGTVRTASWDIVKHLDESRTTMIIREFAYKFMYVKPRKAVLAPYISVKDYKVRGNFLAYHYISHATVMSMMIEAAFYMGFKEIYLIGVDGTTSSSKGGNFAKNYFSEAQRAQLDKLKKKAVLNYDVMKRRQEIQDRQNMVYSKLRDYAEKHGISICNATRGGYLEVFERADLDALLAPENAKESCSVER